MKKVFLSPSDQTKNTYSAGFTNEAEITGRIAGHAEIGMNRSGIETQVLQYATCAAKNAASDKFDADLHIPIHTNACNGKAAGTRLFSYDLTGEGYKACKCIMKYLGPLSPGTSDNIKPYPTLAEIKGPKSPTAYIEVDFHDVPSVAEWLIANTEAIGEAIAHGVCDYLGVAYVPPVETPKVDEAWLREYKAYMATLEDNDCHNYSAEARSVAIGSGVINGIGILPDGHPNYAWEKPVTREELVTILWRAGLLKE